MASHLLDEVQKVCTHFCVLRKGKKLHEGSVSETLGEINKIELAAENMEKLESVIQDFPGQSKYRKNGSILLVTINEDVTATDLNNYCFERGITLKKLFTQRNSLEQEFLKILRENDEGA
jgi:ABC-2 type transport system ATP-binding protein